MNDIQKAIAWMIETTEDSKEAKGQLIALAIAYGCPEKILNNDYRGARLYLEGYRNGRK